jgi:hypothetical protein
MIAIESELKLRAAPEVVWRVLIDFGNYAVWHPTLRLEGPAELGATIDYGLSNTLTGWTSARADARVTRFEPGRVVEWRMGIRLLFQVTESYALRPLEAGTAVVHRIEYRGIGVRVTSQRAVGLWHKAARDADGALRVYLEASKGPSRVARSAPRRGKPRGTGR